MITVKCFWKDRLKKKHKARCKSIRTFQATMVSSTRQNKSAEINRNANDVCKISDRKFKMVVLGKFNVLRQNVGTFY